MTITSEFDVHDHVWTLIDNKSVECIVRTVEFPSISFSPNSIKGNDDKVIYHLVTKVEKTQRRNMGMATLNEDYEFTKHTNEVAESAQALLRKILNEYELKEK